MRIHHRSDPEHVEPHRRGPLQLDRHVLHQWRGGWNLHGDEFGHVCWHKSILWGGCDLHWRHWKLYQQPTRPVFRLLWPDHHREHRPVGGQRRHCVWSDELSIPLLPSATQPTTATAQPSARVVLLPCEQPNNAFYGEPERRVPLVQQQHRTVLFSVPRGRHIFDRRNSGVCEGAHQQLGWPIPTAARQRLLSLRHRLCHNMQRPHPVAVQLQRLHHQLHELPHPRAPATLAGHHGRVFQLHAAVQWRVCQYGHDRRQRHQSLVLRQLLPHPWVRHLHIYPGEPVPVLRQQPGDVQLCARLRRQQLVAKHVGLLLNVPVRVGAPTEHLRRVLLLHRPRALGRDLHIVAATAAQSASTTS